MPQVGYVEYGEAQKIARNATRITLLESWRCAIYLTKLPTDATSTGRA